MKPLFLSIMLLASLLACQNNDARSDGPMLDSGLQGSDPPRDAQGSDGMPSPRSCEWASECPGGDCIDGVCRFDAPQRCEQGAACPAGETCSLDHYEYCATPCEAEETCPLRPRPCALATRCPRSMLCVDGLCVNECVTDQDCGSGHCIEGQCLPFPDILNGDLPAPIGQPGQVYVGASVLPLNFPVGVSMAGYIGRVGPTTPYNKSLGGSDRVLERQDVRVITVATDEQLLILLRMPLCWSTDYLRTLTAIKLQALTVDDAHPNGINYLDNIVSGATHSHSQPGRFWHILPSLGLGVFGYGTFSMEMVERYAEHFARAIKDALDSMEPGRVGWHVIDDFDPDERIHNNRRGQYEPVVDDRLLVWRVEDLDGRPIAGLVNLAIHGTMIQKTWITGDAAAGIEWAATQALSARTDRLAPVLFMNGNAGNVSPRADDSVKTEWGKIQMVGQRLLPIFERAWDAAEPVANPKLEVVTKRIPVTYDLLEYDRSVNEFRDPQGVPYLYGGYFCVTEDARGDGYMDGDLGCRAHTDILGWPVPNVHKAVLSAIRLDDLVVTTLPGEPTSSLGLRLAAEVEADARDAGYPDVRSMNFGYSQDHHLYLLEPNDWWQGGYEASNNWFGWKLGSYLVRNSRLLSRQLFTEEIEDNDTGIKPMWWPGLEDDTVLATATLSRLGEFIFQSAETMRRGQVLTLKWSGGHPGVDLPQVTLVEVDAAGAQSPALRPNGQPYDDAGFESMILYEGDYEADHTWVVRWEMPHALPTGRYHLIVEGNAVQDEAVIRYSIESATLSVEPAELKIRDMALEDGVLAFMVNYADGPTNDDGATPFETLEPLGLLLHVSPSDRIDGHLRRWSFVLGQAVNDPLAEVQIRVDGEVVSTSMVALTPGEVTRRLVTERAADGAETIVELPGWASARAELPVQQPPPFEIKITTATGDSGVFLVPEVIE